MIDLAATYDRIGPSLYRHALALVRRSAEAEDAVHAAFEQPAFEPAQPPESLRERVLALQASSVEAPPTARPRRMQLPAWWSVAAALLVIMVTVFVNRAIHARLARDLGTAHLRAPAELQPYAPNAKIPVSETSWAALRPAEVTE